MSPLGRPWVAVAALLLGPTQDTPPPETRFPAQVEQVTVDVVVVDRRGQPVTGLLRDDFTVLDEGQPQAITSFDVVRPPRPAPGAPEDPAPRRESVASNLDLARERGRLFVVVFDDLHLSPLNARRAKAAVASFLEKGVQDGDRVLLIATAGSAWWSTRVPAGRADLLAVLKHLDGRRILDNASERLTDQEAVQIAVYRDALVAARVAARFERYGGGSRQAMNASQQLQAQRGTNGMIDMYVDNRASEAYMKMRSRLDVTLGILERSFKALEDSRDRKSVLLVSEGFASDPSNPGLRRVADAARRANAVLYFIDTRGLEGLSAAYSAEFGPALDATDLMAAIADVSREGEGAAGLAQETGGFAVRDTNDFAGGTVRIGRESRSYYLLGYTPQPADRADRFRRIEVRVRGKGMVVRARKGYYPASGAPAAPRAATDGPRDPELQRLLDSPGPLDGIPLRLAAHTLEPSGLEAARVLLAAEADVSRLAFGAEGTAGLDTLLVLAHRETGNFERADVKVELQKRAAAAAGEPVWYAFLRPFALKAGGYQAKLAVRDAASGRMGSVILEFEVPPLDQLRVTTPILTDTLQRDDGGGLSPALKVRRAFPSGGQLFCRFDVYGAARGPDGRPRVSAGHTLRRQGGPVLSESPEHAIQPTSLGALLRMIQIPLADAPRGDYELLLTVRDEVSGQRRELVEPFSVVPRAGGGP
jgi:VWFA-related protein